MVGRNRPGRQMPCQSAPPATDSLPSIIHTVMVIGVGGGRTVAGPDCERIAFPYGLSLQGRGSRLLGPVRGTGWGGDRPPPRGWQLDAPPKAHKAHQDQPAEASPYQQERSATTRGVLGGALSQRGQPPRRALVAVLLTLPNIPFPG